MKRKYNMKTHLVTVVKENTTSCTWHDVTGYIRYTDRPTGIYIVTLQDPYSEVLLNLARWENSFWNSEQVVLVRRRLSKVLNTRFTEMSPNADKPTTDEGRISRLKPKLQH